LRDPELRLPRALLVSALALEASFAAFSIASDLRYHLWPMIATALAMATLPPGSLVDRRAVRVGVAVLMLVLIVGLAARLTLPAPPGDYAGMMG
jgi:predicted small integral membrane protein